MVRAAVTGKLGLAAGALAAAALLLRALHAGQAPDVGPEPSLEVVPSWDWDEQPPSLEPAAATSSSSSSSNLATVLPWPSHRRPGTSDDPDLPGGA
jgi:hypothetical protein